MTEKEENVKINNKTCPICKNTGELYPFTCCDTCVDQLVNESVNEENFGFGNLVPIIPDEQLKQVSTEINSNNLLDNNTSKKQKKELSKYYKSLSDWIDIMNELNSTYTGYTEVNGTKKIKTSTNIKILRNANFIVNILILCATSATLFFGTFYTLIAVVALAGLFVVADIVLRIGMKSSKYTKDDIYKYPVGKSRVSTVTILVFSILMIACGTYIIVQCLLSLLAKQIPPKTTIPVYVILGAITLTKLIMYILCSVFTHPIASSISVDNLCGLMAYSLAIFTYWASNGLDWYYDTVGAILISCYILFVWIMNAYENAKMLMGQAAPPELIRRLTYISAHHHPLIINVEQVLAFNVGPKYFAELHIVIPGHIKLHVAHSIGESLQLKVESMPEIDHCWVHVDCENNTQNEHILFMRATGKIGGDNPATNEPNSQYNEEDAEEINTV